MEPTRDAQDTGVDSSPQDEPNSTVTYPTQQNGTTAANPTMTVHNWSETFTDRRRSDSNIYSPASLRNGRNDDPTTTQSNSKRRASQLSSRPVLPQETWQQQRLGSFGGKRYQLAQPPPNKPAPSQLQEDTFYQTLEIRLHHSVGSMSISPSSRDVVLAGRQGLLIIDLEDPWLLPRILPHLSKWEVADVQWSPYISRESWVASTSNQKLLVWNLNYSGSQAIEHVLHAHSRAITDINWSPHHPDMLATCSVDTYVHIWDLRCAGQAQDDQSMRPVHSFTSWNAATTQVKFNRKSEYLLASAHDKDVKIWDIRKGAIPITSIEAHTKKIYGIDWSRHNSHDIVTCSLDQLVKYWNINSPEKEQETIMTNTPVWRARYTPFGNGVLTMPQRSENTLYLYSRSSPGEPMHAFEGHKDTVKEFVWRWKGGAGSDSDDREFQLVTWSKDQNLRLWPITEDIMKSVGHTSSSKRTTARVPVTADEPTGSYPSRSFQQVPDEARESSSTESFLFSTSTSLQGPGGGSEAGEAGAAGAAPCRNGGASTGFTSGYDVISGAYREQRYAINPLLWMQNVKKVGPPSELKNAKLAAENTYQTVAEEMATVLPKYANAGVKIEKVHPASRCCIISLQGPWSDTGAAFLRITIRFSAQYPDNSPPEFEIQKNSMMSIYHRAHMLQDLNNLASSYTSKKRWCLEACIRYLLGETSQEEADIELGDRASGDKPMDSSSQAAGGFGNWNGTSGAGAGAGAIDNGDSDDEFFGGTPFLGMGAGGAFGASGKRSSLQSEKGIVVDMSTKQSADEKVPFPRLCGGVFSGNGKLVCFFSTLRVRDAKRRESRKGRSESEQKTSPTSNNSNAEYFENTYSDFYKHPRTYEQFEEYKEIAAMSRQGRNATVLVGGSGGAFGEYAYDDDPDDMDDGLAAMTSLYLKPDGLALSGSVSNSEDLVYRGSKADRITHQVNVVDLSNLMPFDPALATEYKLSFENPYSVCAHNAAVCRKYGRTDLSRVWYLAAEILRECVPVGLLESELLLSSDAERDRAQVKAVLHRRRLQYSKEKAAIMKTVKKRKVKWGLHPFGQKLVKNLLQHFVKIGDVQTAAMLSCTFQTPSFIKAHGPHSKKANPFDGHIDNKPSVRSQALHRSGSGPIALNTGSPDRMATTQLSSSYGPRGVTFLSYFWDSPPQGDKVSETTMEAQPAPAAAVASSSPKGGFARPFSTALPMQRLPSNTAPGLRSPPGSPHIPTTLIPPIPLTSTVVASTVSDKEGKTVHSEEMTIEFTNLDSLDMNQAYPYTSDVPLIDPMDAAQLDVLRLNYADMLYRLGLLEQRAQVLKFLTKPVLFSSSSSSKDNNTSQTDQQQQQQTTTMQIQIRCYVCCFEIAGKERICYNCRKHRNQIKCSLCHVLVKGTVNFCFKCGHGGHSTHIKQWFQQSDVCPTGCGCACVVDN